MKITILCNNSVKTFTDCIGEHGFSAFIETETGNYLFDTGAGVGILKNSILLGKDLRSIRALILSHGHRDHCGGLEKVLRFRKAPTPIYAHPSIFSDRYGTYDNGKMSFAGINFRREYLESLGAEFRMSTGFTSITENIFLTGEVKRENDFELLEKKLLVKNSITGEFETDPVPDDNSLVFKSGKGAVIITGCAHPGLVNIIDHVARKLNTDTIHAVIGGTHLAEAESYRMGKTIEALNKYHVQLIGTCHCTGPEKEAMLKSEFGDKFHFAHAGCEFSF